MKRMLAVLVLASLAALAVPVEAAPTEPLGVYLVAPCRLVDTRTSAPISGDHSFTVRGLCEVPDDAIGLVVNVTALGATAPGHLVLWDGSFTRPATSVLSFVAGGQPVSNEVTVRLKELAGGAAPPWIPRTDVTVTAVTTGTVHVLLDVVGYLRGE